MSAKETFYHQPSGNITGYQDITLDDTNKNPVYLEMTDPEEFDVAWESGCGTVKLAIPAEIFDELAVAWCRKRRRLVK